MPIHEIGIGRARDIGHVGRIHPHIAPVKSVLEGLVFLGQQTGQRLPLIIEIATADLLELPENCVRMHLAMVGEHDDMLSIRLNRILAFRVDDNRSVMT